MLTQQYTTELHTASESDVLVVGGGPAGIAAAVSAARAGARTVLVERYGSLGGNLTAGLVGPCMTSFSLDGRTQLIRGVFDEFVRRMEDMGQALHPSRTSAADAYAGFIEYGHDKVTPFEPEAAKTVALRMCLEAGVELALHTFVCDSLVEDGQVRGVVTADKDGLRARRATVVVDCSADGDVAYRAGAATVSGRDSDGLVQPMTLFFRVSGIDDEAVERYVRAHTDDFRPFASIVAAAREAGRFPAPRMGVGMYKTLRPGVWRINTTRILGKDGTSTADLTAAEIEGREQALRLLDFFRAELPGFEKCELLDTAATVGVRETRRVTGEYVLTLEDLQTGRHFDDVIAMCAYPVDIHDPAGSGGGSDEKWGTANAYEIPYRSLVPRDIDQLLVAGRCASASHEAMAAIRVMPPAFAMGEAAGAAAALAVEAAVTARKIDIGALQRRLLIGGAYLGEQVSELSGT
ncbi:FAD-dependent oxidoreductase [Pseudonocardia sp. MH-G8]|uniref:FAD-dependent oxidoreductase n=1 Tax=Pseudonocardia sp. MH-G8 TaxID=1854588 RepID=UPI000BA0FED7|nr:FAD-dependent oxidoreductase [Pseudonocardia sp. MH-G8]OZM77138.1 FAD-dependent oxidoreductase [Pseudonocardia sp. MH-G8]